MLCVVARLLPFCGVPRASESPRGLFSVTFCGVQKVTKEALGDCPSFPESIKGTVLMLLFRLYEKVTKKYTRGVCPSGLPENGSKLYAGMLFIEIEVTRV